MDESDNYSYFDYNLTTDTCDVEELDMQVFQNIFKPVFYSLILVLGVAGNGLMVTVLLRRRHRLRITEIYLLHLAVADLMLLCTLPFDVAHTIHGWLFGNFLCKLMGLVQNLNLFCGSFLLAYIGFDRYLAIVHAIPSMQSRRTQTVHLTCVLLWLVCLGFSIPNAVFLKVKDEAPNSSLSRVSCYYHEENIHANNWVLTNRVLIHACFFSCLVVMTYCYTAIVGTLFKSQKSQSKQGAIRLALLVTLVFCFCWLPYNIALLMITMDDLSVIQDINCPFRISLKSAKIVTETLAFCHCCLNPFLYAFVGVRFRNELIQLLCEVGCSRLCLPFIRAQGHSRASISDGLTTTSTF
ncbi:C-X-C chemokine receptor type 5 [Sphaeramia orbicularis]|nr:C-X-C chemokine receptor type 5-like [Sphaeramia orbicularis]